MDFPFWEGLVFSMTIGFPVALVSATARELQRGQPKEPQIFGSFWIC